MTSADQLHAAAPIETGRLTLRRLTEDDAEFIVGLLNEPSFLQFIGDRGVRTPEDARAYIQKGPVASYERYGFGLLLVTRNEDGAPIGMCGLLKRDALEDVDVGFAFRPAYWSQGYAFEAASAVIAHGKRMFGLTRVAAIAQPDNAGSIRVLDKLGLRFERMVTMPGETKAIQFWARDLA